MKAVKEIYPEVKTQRCLTNIHRQVRNKLTRKPKIKALKEFIKLITFKALNNEKLFVKKFNLWEEKYSNFLNEKTFKWNNFRYTHSNLKLVIFYCKKLNYYNNNNNNKF